MRAANYPPPDSYNPSYHSVKERNASWSFGSGKRSNLASTGLFTPAPGTYKFVSHTIEGPKYHMGLKLDS